MGDERVSDRTTVEENRSADPKPAQRRQHVAPSLRHTEANLRLRDGGQQHPDLQRQIEQLVEPDPDRDMAPSQIGRFQDLPLHGVHHGRDHEIAAQQAAAIPDMLADQAPALLSDAPDDAIRIPHPLDAEFHALDDVQPDVRQRHGLDPGRDGDAQNLPASRVDRQGLEAPARPHRQLAGLLHPLPHQTGIDRGTGDARDRSRLHPDPGRDVLPRYRPVQQDFPEKRLQVLPAVSRSVARLTRQERLSCRSSPRTLP